MRPLNYLFNGDFKGFFLGLLFLLPALVIALSFHEASHAWMANKMGDPTAKNLGRLTLDPTKHFDLFGVLSFLFIGFGWGKPVPINPRNYHNYKKANVLVALSGVTINLIISVFVFIIIAVLSRTGMFSGMYPSYLLNSDIALTTADIFHTILFYIAYINLILFFFNLIPIPPLDGHHLVKGFIARKSPRFYMSYQRYGFLALIVLMFAVPGFSSVLWSLVNFVIQGVASIFGVRLFGVSL